MSPICYGKVPQYVCAGPMNVAVQFTSSESKEQRNEHKKLARCQRMCVKH